MDTQTFGRCRRMSREIRRLQSWPDVRDALRPRGVTGFLRSRAPLSVQLYRAGREGRLLLDGDALAVVESPAAVQATTGGPMTTWSVRGLRMLDDGWDPLAAMIPVLLLMLVSIPIAVLGAPRVALGVVAAAVLLVAVLMASSILRQLAILLAGRSRLVGAAVGQLRAWHPTVTLLHAQGAAAATALVRRAHGLAGHRPTAVLVVAAGVTAAAPDEAGSDGFRLRMLSGTHPLWVGTTPTDPPLAIPDAEVPFRLRDVGLILAGTVVVLGIVAWFVARDEERICAPTCDGVPATYGDAVYWLVSRLVGGDPDGLGAAGPYSRMIGLLVTVYGVYVLVSIVGRVLRQRMSQDSGSGRAVVESFEAERSAERGVPGAPTRAPLRRRRSTGSRRPRVAGRARAARPS